MTYTNRTVAPVLEQTYRFLLWLIPTVEKSPRSQKFLLGDRIQTTALGVLERLIEATYSKSKGKILSGVNLGIEKLRFLFRLATDLRYLGKRRYEYVRRHRSPSGRMDQGEPCPANMTTFTAILPISARSSTPRYAPQTQHPKKWQALFSAERLINVNYS